MVFKPINLARQSFLKTFTHGYAQSLVAASQSSSASHNTPLQSLHSNFFAKPTQHAQHLHTSSGSVKLGGHPDGLSTGGESGLAAYYAAWQKHQKTEDKEWHQFQFAKRLGWKAPTTIPDVQHGSSKGGKTSPSQSGAETRTDQPLVVDGARAATPVDQPSLPSSQHVQLDAQRIVEVDDAVAREIEAASRALDDNDVADSVLVENDPIVSSKGPSASPGSSSGNGQTVTTAPTSVSEAELYVEQLVQLAETNRYAEVPAVFEAMLLAGIKPTASAYNTLLLAAITLPRGRHHVVPKVLDVYSDMLRRRVSPDTATYAILIELMAARALDVAAMKKEINMKRLRYALPGTHQSFMFNSDEAEHDILAEDDSLELAIKLFDTSAAVPTNHRFSPETYRLILTACAEHGRVGDMVRIYADMESQRVIPPTSIFSSMIEAFATTGDLRSAVECYDEYKALAVANDDGLLSIVRKDEEVYAAVVKAYATCGRSAGGLKFLGKIEDAMEASPMLPLIRDTVALQTLYPQWLSQDLHSQALEHASSRLTDTARPQALATICIDAADKGNVNKAIASLNMMSEVSIPAIAAVLAMFVRCGDLEAASDIWKQLCSVERPSAELVEPSTMYALSLINSGNAEAALQATRQMFNRIRQHDSSHERAHTDMIDRMDEAITMIGQAVLKSAPVPSLFASVELIRMMTENGALDKSIAEHLVAGLGPNEISALAFPDIHLLLQVQAGLLATHSYLDIAHAARLSHLLDISASTGLELDAATSKLVDQALLQLNQPELISKWQAMRYPAQAASMLPATPYVAPYSPVASSTGAVSHEDNFDPYSATTDLKGSNMIAEELEKTNGRHAQHLNEALTRFKNMRRTGRHPRYVVYAKLINAAAKENRPNLAQEILAMARQDVPLVPQSRIVRHGWASILDAAVGACLTMGNRDLAGQHHQELINMGAAPSANTFGLYITTLKGSTKTFDEATEAVKIFHRAKAEGIEPSSFLYNALIGKLGKARRIDDCLFYFAEMRSKGIRPTSVTYGTVVNALCRVSDDKFAEELFEEMESMPNYKPRPAPYNSLMQYFLTTKRDRSKVLDYYNRMVSRKIQPTMHTYKLLIDTHATLEPIDMPAAEAVLATIRASGAQPEAVHFASLIHAKGCAQHDMEGARAVFDSVIREGRIQPQPALYQALFESMVANHDVEATEPLLAQMGRQGVELTAYIANTLIHGWATAGDVNKAKQIYDKLGREGREPSTYEAMVRAFLSAEERGRAKGIVGEALARGYPAAVASRICELVGGGSTAQ